jgi:hypothetical protein
LLLSGPSKIVALFAPLTGHNGRYLNVWTPISGRDKIKANMWNTDESTKRPED